MINLNIFFYVVLIACYKKIQLILSLKVKVRDGLLFDTRGLVFIINTCIHAVVFHMLQTIVKTSDHVMCKKKPGKI